MISGFKPRRKSLEHIVEKNLQRWSAIYVKGCSESIEADKIQNLTKSVDGRPVDLLSKKGTM